MFVFLGLDSCPPGTTQWQARNTDFVGTGLVQPIQNITNTQCHQKCLSNSKCAYFQYFSDSHDSKQSDLICELHPEDSHVNGNVEEGIICSMCVVKIRHVQYVF